MSDESASAEGVFRRSTMNRVASSEELDHYIKVTNPSAWLVALAAFLLVCGIVIWAVVAIVPVTVETTGFAPVVDNQDDAYVICFVDKQTAARMHNSKAKAFIEDVEAESVQITDTPLSASEVVSYLGSDFYADSLKLDDWNYVVSIKPAAALNYTDFQIGNVNHQDHLVPVSLVVSETEPINIVLGSKD